LIARAACRRGGSAVVSLAILQRRSQRQKPRVAVTPSCRRRRLGIRTAFSMPPSLSRCCRHAFASCQPSRAPIVTTIGQGLKTPVSPNNLGREPAATVSSCNNSQEDQQRRRRHRDGRAHLWLLTYDYKSPIGACVMNTPPDL